MASRYGWTIALLCCLCGGAGVAASSPARAAGPNPAWAQWNASSKTATLSVVAASTGLSGGFNFNGYNNGALVITVPRGAKVVVRFANKAPIPHSAVITPFAKKSLTLNFPLAFAGSASPNPTSGITNASKPQTFSFTASKEGTYALVCGVPGHSVGGMWITFKVAGVARPMLSATAATGGSPARGGGMAAMAMCGRGDSANGAVGGVVTDATSGKPLAHAFVVVGWTTAKRVSETDAQGQYCVDHVPPVAYTDAFGFAQGYVYYHGHPVTIRAGKTVSYSFRMPRQAVPADQLPLLAGATVDHTRLAAGTSATFSVHVTPGKGGQMSAEVFAVNATLGTSVLLAHRGGDLYSGTYTIPAASKAGAYTFTFFGAMHNCLENARYLSQSVTVTR